MTDPTYPELVARVAELEIECERWCEVDAAHRATMAHLRQQLADMTAKHDRLQTRLDDQEYNDSFQRRFKRLERGATTY